MQRLPGLDTLRALAIVLVMLFHSWVVGGMGPTFDPLVRYGWVGVDIFFVLSGFLIGSQVLAPLARGEGLALGDFYRRRAYRILPAFAVVLALYQCVPVLRELPGIAPWWQFATFTMNLLIDYRSQPAFSHAWSLCVEEHFYLLFPLLAIALVRLRSGRALLAVALLVVLGGIALRTGVWCHDTAVQPDRNWYIEDLYFPTWDRLDGLFVGVMLAALKAFRLKWWMQAQARAQAAMWLGLLVTGGALLLFRDRAGLLPNAIGWPLLSVGLGLLVFAAAGQNSTLGRWRVPGAGWLAGISYSLYLSHKIAYHLVQVALGEHLHGVAIFVVYAAAALAMGSVLHMAVERPFLRLRDRSRPRGLGAATA
ncbi:DNA-dirted RNA polymerase [Dyella thiooxydans]|uniref:DNA-dirted RNA polymerase n=1 Tax=Dyella thiooxydans TaxID=445710 RepID=A0A160MZ02_9GAMM|nr:acyltransferase [Dyella thiooxydans]AND67912.1 DNA-dirted RNA polymerase [Dyella thiooxydans]